MTRVALTAAVVVLVALPTMRGDVASAQSVSAAQQDALRQQIERRFDVLPLRNGLALRPKRDNRRVRSIELADGTIAIDGAPATGAELRDKLGADADLVLRLSYLDADARQRLFGPSVPPPAPAAPPAVSAPPAPASPPAEAAPAAPDAPAPPVPPERPRRPHDTGNDRVRFGGSVTVNEGEVIDGDVVAIGGSARIDGEVTGNAVGIGGGVDLGPHADVAGDVVSIGAPLKRDPGARIGGKVVDVGTGNFDVGRWRWDRLEAGRLLFPFLGAAAGLFALTATLARVAVLFVLVSLVMMVGREYVERVGVRAVAEPVRAGLVGLLAQILFIPVLILTVLVLVVTIIGIPLLVLVPFAVLALAVVGLVGFTAVAANLGRLVNRRFDWHDRSPYVTAITGVVLLMSPVLIARLVGLAGILVFPLTGTLALVGFLVEYVAWTVGFGAVALLRFSRPGTMAPPATA